MLRKEDDAIRLLLADAKDMRFVAKIKKIISTFSRSGGVRASLRGQIERMKRISRLRGRPF
jgi:hypothetical protein